MAGMGAMRRSVAIALLACSLDSALAIHAGAAGHRLAAPRRGIEGAVAATARVGALRRPQEPLEGLRGGAEVDPIGGLTVSLIKNIVGSGMLALPAGVAAFSDEKGVVPLTVALGVVAAAFAGYCFTLVGKVCLKTGATSYKEAWVKSIGQDSAWVPVVFVALKTFIACLCYSIIIADLLRDIAASLDMTGIIGNRDVLLTAITITVLLPLCLLRSFKALQKTSILGIFGTFASITHMTYRWIQGDYAPGGQFYDALPHLEKPKFDIKGTSALRSLILISTLTSSYFAHYNAPKFLNEIKQGDRQAKFNLLSAYGFGGSFFFNTVMMITGFLTFGGSCKGLILNSYTSTDQLANVARVGVLLSVIFGYPHSYVGLRDGIILSTPSRKVTQQALDIFAVVTLSVLTVLATKVKDLGVVVALFGALLGSCIIYVFPALMMVCLRRTEVRELRKKMGAKRAHEVTYGQEYYINMLIATVGVGFGSLGVAVVLLKNFTDLLK